MHMTDSCAFQMDVFPFFSNGILHLIRPVGTVHVDDLENTLNITWLKFPLRNVQFCVNSNDLMQETLVHIYRSTGRRSMI